MAKKMKPAQTAPTPVARVTQNPFGEVSEEQMAGDTLHDAFYLEGYSNKRHERDIAMRDGRTPETLPRRFQFVGVEPVGKAPAGDKELEFRRLGYKPVMWEEAAALGLDLANSAAKKGPDGTIRVGSQMLMVTDAKTAARRFRDQREATERLQETTKSRLEEAADNYNSKYGLTKEAGTKFEIEETVETRYERR